MEDLELEKKELEEYIKNTTLEFSKEKEITEKSQNYTYDITYCEEEGITSDVAFCTSTLSGDIYHIFVNNEKKNEQAKKFLLFHELGHILFGHCSIYGSFQEQIAKLKIRKFFDNIAPYFNSVDDTAVTVDTFYQYINNIVVDMEVNSKLFTDEEFTKARTYLCALYQSSDYKGVHPMDYELPDGLTAENYLTLFLRNPTLLFQDGNGGSGDNNDQSNQQGNQQNSNGQGQGNQQGNQNQQNGNGQGQNGQQGNQQNSNGQGNNQKPSKEQIQKVIDDINKFQEKKEAQEKELQKKMEQMAAELGGAMGCKIGDGSEFEKVENAIEGFDSIKKLEKTMYNALFTKEEKNEFRDVMYNYNRNKLNSSICVPKDRYEKFTDCGELLVILDVSGSVSRELLGNFCNLFKKLAKKTGKKYRLIFWNTQLVSEYTSIKDIELYAGGGTDIAGGIEYARKYFKDNTSFFVVSDFEDSLEKWKTTFEKGKKPVRSFGICWEPRINKDYLKNNCGKIFEKIFIADESF